MPRAATLAAIVTVCWSLVGAASLRADDALERRRIKIEAMTPEQREELAERRSRFAKLSREEQEHLRELSAQIDADPDSQKLHGVIQSYYDWLKTLPPYQQAELKRLPLEERIAKIKSLREAQAKAELEGGLGPPGPGGWRRPWEPGVVQFKYPPTSVDIEAAFAWLEGYLKEHGQALYDTIPRDKRGNFGKKFEAASPTQRSEILAQMWVRWQIENRAKAMPLSESDLADLRSKLTPTTRGRVESLSTEEQRRWAGSMLFMYWQWRMASRRGGVPPAAFKAQDLDEYYEKHIPPQLKDRLATLPSEQMQVALWWNYVGWKFRGAMSGKAPPKMPRRGGNDPKAVFPRGAKPGPGEGIPPLDEPGPTPRPAKTPPVNSPPEKPAPPGTPSPSPQKPS